MIENVLLCRERSHAVTQQNQRLSGILFLGNAGELDQVLDKQVESAFAEISEVLRGTGGAAVSAVIVAVHDEVSRLQNFNQLGVTADVLAETVGDLQDAARGPAGIPALACDAQAVVARKPKLF